MRPAADFAFGRQGRRKLFARIDLHARLDQGGFGRFGIFCCALRGWRADASEGSWGVRAAGDWAVLQAACDRRSRRQSSPFSGSCFPAGGFATSRRICRAGPRAGIFDPPASAALVPTVRGPGRVRCFGNRMRRAHQSRHDKRVRFHVSLMRHVDLAHDPCGRPAASNLVRREMLRRAFFLIERLRDCVTWETTPAGAGNVPLYVVLVVLVVIVMLSPAAIGWNGGYSSSWPRPRPSFPCGR